MVFLDMQSITLGINKINMEKDILMMEEMIGKMVSVVWLKENEKQVCSTCTQLASFRSNKVSVC